MMFKSILAPIIGFFKKVIFELNAIETASSCNKKVINKGSFFLPEAKVENMQNDRSKFVLGKGSNIRGAFIIFPYGGEITIGDNCYIGEGTRIWSGESIRIGNNVLISHNVNIVDTIVHEIDHIERANGYLNLLKYGHLINKGSIATQPIVIEDHVWINFNSIILKGVTLGKGAVVAAGSVVTKNVPPFVLVGGNPARVIKKLPDNIPSSDI
jgi:acetyltransferase-like isoleucine patch superfamily enzyme